MRKFQELGMMLLITKSVIGDRSPSKTKSCLLDIIHSIRTRHFLAEHLLLHNFRINMEVQLTDRESIHSSVRLEIWSKEHMTLQHHITVTKNGSFIEVLYIEVLY